MTFLLPSNLELSPAAREKILSDRIDCEHVHQIASLFYARENSDRSKDVKAIAEELAQFFWGCHVVIDVPYLARWSIEGFDFAVQDGRWHQEENLFMDVIEGAFWVERRCH